MNIEEKAFQYASEKYTTATYKSIAVPAYLAGAKEATAWIAFAERQPELGQKFWIWASYFTEPEPRTWDEQIQRGFDIAGWDGIYWLPIPPTPPETK